MSSQVLTLRLSESLGDRLGRLVERTHRTKAFYAREALEQHLEDIEDYYLAAELSRQVAAGTMETEDWGDLQGELELA